MPEGPSIVLLQEEAAKFAGRRILAAEGNTTIAKERLVHQCVNAVGSFGKNFLLELPKFTLRVHFMLWGSWRIDQEKAGATPRLALRFANGELNLYSCSVRFIDEPLHEVYDFRRDVLSPAWDAALARATLRAQPDTLVCDALLDQDVFAGVGNIIKNEVLFRIRLHPLSTVGALPPARLRELVEQARQYSFDFYEWKKAFVLRKHWLAHTKRICPRCDIPFHKGHLGKTMRRSFWCENCQVRY
jgi:endonuclease-8